MTTLDPDTFLSADSPAGNFVSRPEVDIFQSNQRDRLGKPDHTAPAEGGSDFLWIVIKNKKAEVRKTPWKHFWGFFSEKMSLKQVFFSMHEFHVLDIYIFVYMFVSICMFV